MSKPPVFADLDYTSALEASRREGRLLLLDATAGWCGPCKVMDRTAWIDPAVIDWIRQHAIAIQIDVDAEPATAKQFEIRAMPTVIAFKDGVEFDRAVGLKQPAELLSWLDGVMWGENSLVKLTAEAAEQPANMFGRMKLARALANAGKLDQATDAYVWLWQHVLEHDPAMVGVRFSFMLAEIGDLVGRHPPARTKFATLRDAAAPQPESVPASFDDWVALNQALGELEKTLQWYDREREQLASKTELAPLLERAVVPLLIERERWADAGRVYVDPVASVRQHHEIIGQFAEHRPPEMDDAEFDELRGHIAAQFRNAALQVHRCLIAAGRSDEAAMVVAAARELDPALSFH